MKHRMRLKYGMTSEITYEKIIKKNTLPDSVVVNLTSSLLEQG